MANITNSTTDPFNTFIPITSPRLPSFQSPFCDRYGFRTPNATGVVAFSPLTNETLPLAKPCCGEIWLLNNTCEAVCGKQAAQKDIRDLYNCFRDNNRNGGFWWVSCQDASCTRHANGGATDDSERGNDAEESGNGSAAAGDRPVAGSAARTDVGKGSVALGAAVLASLMFSTLML